MENKRGQKKFMLQFKFEQIWKTLISLFICSYIRGEYPGCKQANPHQLFINIKFVTLGTSPMPVTNKIKSGKVSPISLSTRLNLYQTAHFS